MRVPTSDSQLVRATLTGSRSSFDMLVEKYRDQVYRLAYFKVHRADEAEDLAQDAFVAAYQSLGQLRDYDRFGPWLRRIADNVCSMHLRRRRVETVPLEDCQAPADDVSREVERRIIDARVRDALAKLSETNRLAAALFFVDGFSQKEIAGFLDVPVGTIKRRINLSRTRLQKEMIDMMKDSLGPQKPSPEFNTEVTTRIDIIRWYQRFSEYIDAGVTLVRSLDLLEKDDFCEKIKQETLAVKSAIMEGSTLSQAMRSCAPSLSHPMAAGFIRAGEIGGILQEGLRSAVAWMRREDVGIKVEAATWCRTLGSMFLAGVPIVQAVDTMKTVRAGEPFPELPDRINGTIRKGGRFTNVLAEYPAVFSPSVLALIRSGECSGLLEAALIRASSELIREAYEQLRNDPMAVMSDSGKAGLAEGVRVQLGDESAEIRMGALQAFDQLTGADSLDTYLNALSDSDASVREAAVVILGTHPAEQSVKPLVQAIHDASPRVREAVLNALASIDPDAAFDCAIRAVNDSDVSVRKAAVRVLGMLGRPDSTEALIGALIGDEPSLSHQALRSLAGIGRPALPVLLGITEESAPNGLGQVLEAILRIDPATARDAGLRLIQSDDPEVRDPALRILASVADPGDVSILAEALSSPDDFVALRSAEALGRMKATSAVPALIAALDRPEEWVVNRVEAALGLIGDKHAAPALAEKLSADNPRLVVESAVNALADMGAKEYAGRAVDMVLEFARRNTGVGGSAIRLAGEPEVSRMLDALTEPGVGPWAAGFLGALVRWREGGRDLANSAHAVPRLIQALGAAPEDLRPRILDVLVLLAGREESIRQVESARDEGKLSRAVAAKVLADLKSRLGD